MADAFWDLEQEFPALAARIWRPGHRWQQPEGCLAQVEQWARMHSLYLERYGQLAPLPLPLSFTPEQGSVLCYRGQPQRVADLSAPAVSPSLSMLVRLGYLRALGDPRVICSRWVELVGRLLSLGFVGQIGPGQLLLDGGLWEVKFTCMQSVESYAEVEQRVQATVASLADSIGFFLLGERPPADECVGAVEMNLLRLWREEQEGGLRLPLPLANMLKERPCFDRLVERFRERWP